MAVKASSRPMPTTLLGRVIANTVWLLGGKGFGAVCSLAYLAILTRALDLKGFGHFSLIFGTSQALAALAGFQTWRVVVRYGAEHVHEKRWEEFGRLGMLCGLLDAAGAVLGCAIAYVAIYQFGDQLDLNPELVDIAFYFNCAMLWALVSAPTGLVRALDRFDVAVYVEALVPVGRLLAAGAIWITGPSLVKFLIAWAVIDVIEAILYWGMAKYLCPQAVRFRHFLDLGRTAGENPGLWRFLMINYLSTSLDSARRYGPLLVVGLLAGTRAAGLFRLASQLSQALGKLSTLLTRSVYPEIARARVVAAAAEFRKLVVQTSLIAGGAGVVVVLLAVVAGGHLLGLLGGEEFRAGYVIMIPLTIAAAFELASVAFEPVLHSIGRARQALIARVVSLIALIIALAPIINMDSATGVAWAVAISGAVFYLLLGGMARNALRAIDREKSDGRGGYAGTNGQETIL